MSPLQPAARPFQPSFHPNQQVPPRQQQQQQQQQQPGRGNGKIAPGVSGIAAPVAVEALNEKMAKLKTDDTARYVSPGARGVQPTPSPRHLAAAQAEAARQIQLHQQHLMHLQFEAQQAAAIKMQQILTAQRRQPASTSAQDAMALLSLQQAQLAAAASNPQLQAHLLMQIQAQRALLLEHLKYRQADLRRQIEYQHAQEMEMDFGSDEQEQLAILRGRSPSKPAQGERSDFANRLQARTKIREEDLRARFESVPNPSAGEVFDSGNLPNPEKFGWVSPTSASSQRSPSISSVSEYDQFDAALQSPLRLGRVSSGSQRSDEGSNEPVNAVDATRATPTVSKHFIDNKRPMLGIGRPKGQEPAARAATTPRGPVRSTPAVAARAVTAPITTQREVKPIRQPYGPPAPANELGDRNFQTSLRKKAGLNLGMLGRRTEPTTPLA